MTAVVNGAEQLCHCEFTAGHIDRGVSGFRCSNQHNQVVFRSKLNGTLTTNASTLTNYIHQWTSSGTITVLGLILEVDSMCPVHISSFTDPECVSVTDVSTTSIVGGVVAAACVIAIAVIVAVVVVAVVIKRRRTSYELRDLNRRYIRSYCTL